MAQENNNQDSKNTASSPTPLNLMEDQASPKLLPRVSISNLKSPSRRRQSVKMPVDHPAAPISMLDFLPELKQFVSFFNIHFYYQKTISDQETQLKLRYMRLHQTLTTLEQKPATMTRQACQQQQQQSSQQQNMGVSTPLRPRANSSVLLQPGAGNQNTTDSGKRQAGEENDKAIAQLVVELFDLFRETIGRSDLPSNILKGTLRTVSKLFEYKRTLVQILASSSSWSSSSPAAAAADQSKGGFKPGQFLKTMFECQFDTHDTYQEEIILLTIQKIVIQVTKNFSDLLTSDEIFKSCVYFFRVLKKRAINDLQITSMHMQEGTKQNMNKLFSVVMSKQDPPVAQPTPPSTAEESKQEKAESEEVRKYTFTKHKLFDMFARKVLKNIKKMNEQKQNPNAVEIDTGCQGYICFIVKAFSESFAALARSSNQEEVRSFIVNDKEILFKVMCVAGEFQDIVIRSMAQLLFSQVLQKVLELQIPFREEIEVLYVKLLLKPLEQLDQKMVNQGPVLNQSLSQSQGAQQDKDQMQIQTVSQAAAMGDVSFLSDEEDNAGVDDNRIAGQPVAAANVYDPNQVQNQFELDTCMNALIETLLSLQPDQLAQLFLVYDCQPLSENLIRRSLHLLLKHSQLQGKNMDLTKCFQVIGLVMRSLLRYQMPTGNKQFMKMESQGASLRGMQSILEMLAQKNKVRKIAKKANEKPKAFFQAIESTYEGVTLQQVCKVAAKVLLLSRRVSLDKIAEIIGGKDDKAKQCLEDYIERQDYAECDIEKSMRGFLQTFRMAGVESQVIFNILEKFGHKCFEKDHKNTFTSGEEAYNFTYLIIVLQTCQHNPHIKEKTSIERFYSQAKEMVPESYDNLPEGMVEAVFHKVTQQEIKAPVTRDLVTGDYDLGCGQFEIDFRTLNSTSSSNEPLSESDFLSTADLREVQLFERDNRILGVAPEILQLSALRQIVNILTAKFCKIRQTCGESRFNQYRTLELTKMLIQANGHFKNNDWVDRLILDFDKQVEAFCRISKLEDERKNSIKSDLQNLFWSNFKSLSLATGLIPKMAPSMSRSNIHYASFNAVETKIRNKFNKDIPDYGLVTQVEEHKKEAEESKTIVIDAVNTNVVQTNATTPVKSEQAPIGSPDPKKLSTSQQPTATTPRQQSGLFNMVYNYFTPVPTEAEEEARKREYIMSGQNQIDLLKHQLEDFNRHAKSEVYAIQGPENVNDSYFFDFLISKGIETGDALKQIAHFIRLNMNSRRATLCLSYLYRVYLDSQSSQDHETSLQVRYTILQLCQSLVHCITLRETTQNQTTSISSTARRQEYGNIALSTQEGEQSDSGQDANDSFSQKSDSTADLQMLSSQGVGVNLAKVLLKEPRKNQFESEIALWVNKHLALELYFTVIGSYIVSQIAMDSADNEDSSVPQGNGNEQRQTVPQLIKDVQKTLTALSEDELTRDDFEQAFLYSKLAEFIKPTMSKINQVSTSSAVSEDDEGTQKPNETGVEESKRSISSSQESQSASTMTEQMRGQMVQQVLPLREYPKIGKFLRLLIISMLQVNVKICNTDQMQLNLVRLLRSISDMFLLLDTVPYDQINLGLDVLSKHCHPFRIYHRFSESYLEDLLAICQNFFQLLERGSDGREQKLFQKGQFDLWFKTMSIMNQKILLSPYIELFKSIQERCCTLVKIQILCFQFQPLTDGTANTRQAEQVSTLRNYTKVIFEELVFTLSIAQLLNQREWLHQQVDSSAPWLQRYKLGWEDKHDGFAQLCQLCASTLTDVFIQYAQSMAQESDQKEESYEMFSQLWNKFLLVLLNYADSTESLLVENTEVHTSVQPLQQSIQDSIQRVMEFLLSQKLLLLKVPEGDESTVSRAKAQLYNKTRTALGHFWQEVQISQQQQD